MWTCHEIGAVRMGESFGDASFLSSDEQPNAQVRVIAKRESTEINAFLGDSVLRQPSSVELEWNNFAVERRTSLPYEEPELILQHHFLILWDVHVAEGGQAVVAAKISGRGGGGRTAKRRRGASQNGE